MSEILFGKPATSNVEGAAYDFTKDFYENIAPALLASPRRAYPGQLNPGFSPYLQQVMQLGMTYGAPGAQGNVGGGSQGLNSMVSMPPPPGGKVPIHPGSINPWIYPRVRP